MTDGFSKHWLASKMTNKNKLFETSFDMKDKDFSFDKGDPQSKKKYNRD